MTAFAEPKAESGTGLGHVGIITEDATIISVEEYDKAPVPCREPSLPASDSDEAAAEKPASELNVKDDLSDSTVTAATGCGDDKPAAAPTKWCRLLQWVKKVPSYIWIALAVLLIMETVAVVGAIFYARSVNTDNRRAAADVARSSARSIETLLDHLIAPMMSLASLVELQPHWPTVNASFPTFANAVYKTNPYFQVELCPYGVVGAMAMPWINASGTLTPEEDWKLKLSFEFGLDMLDPKRPSFENEIDAILPNGSVILLGPWYMPDGELAQGAFVVRYSIFIPPGDWDMPSSSIQYCPQNVCTTGTGLKWWGWSNAVFAWKTVAAGIKVLNDRNLLYTLAPDPQAANQSFLAKSNPLPDPDECEVVYVNVYGWMYWTFCVEPEGGFGPSWRTGLLVGVTALAVLLAVLVGLVFRSRHQAVQYLGKQMELNRQLVVAKDEAEEGRRVIEAEKKVMDALVQRQRNLIELFGKEDELLAGLEGDEALAAATRRETGVGPSGSHASTLSRESAAMDRIEAVRRQLTGQRSNKYSQNETNGIKLMDMLGEGSFGKVYRGLWRGTDVAVKTMVLPANMSGAEKREKMAIMEAAISSSLAHPNIVQTYTYFIKTVREEVADEAIASAATDGILVGGPGDATTVSTTTGSSKTFDEPSGRSGAGPSAQAVHGYEVRLVLEFCDRGCLRDALDGDAFLTSSGVNYGGVLDTAADIAKAMLHLHFANVLHGDLKARNVMLKSSGTEGRGVIGKVADFGLAVKMDAMEQTHMSGMYQGTLTHMAPELLLHGRMSKAADVYAFGITLWELFTGGNVFQGVPRALLGHQIAQERKRPVFPPFAPAAYVKLASDCWAHIPEDRPMFEAILERLASMRSEVPGPAAPLSAYDIGAPANQPSPAPGAPPLPKLEDGMQGVTATANPIFDPCGMPAVGAGGSGVMAAGSGIAIGTGGSGGGSGSGSGSGINWMFARTSHRTPLAVVQEDDREMDLSSKPLPVVNTEPEPQLPPQPEAKPQATPKLSFSGLIPRTSSNGGTQKSSPRLSDNPGYMEGI